MTATSNIQTLRRAAGRGLISLIWLHLPLLAAVAGITGHDRLGTEVLALLLVVTATAAWRLAPDSQKTRLTVAVALVGMVSLVVFQLNGQAWQVDSHMYFFATLAVLATYCDWKVLVMAAGAMAMHHLVLNFLLPAAIYPGGSDFGRVVLHTVIVVLETGALVWLTATVAASFAAPKASAEAADHARLAEAAARADQAAPNGRVEQERVQRQHHLAQVFEAHIGTLMRGLAHAVANVRSNGVMLADTMQTAAARSGTVMSASRDTSANVQTMATAAEQLAATGSAISGQIGCAADIANRAVERTSQTTVTMQQLAEMVGRIEAVVALINGSAGQTNLLALNATIEAARAADAGKGFAVVANKVKALASQTTGATEEIRNQIAAIQNETSRAVAAIGGLTEVIADLCGITVSVANAVEQQSAAIADIARSAQQAAQNSEAVFSNLSVLDEAATQTGAAADASQAASVQLSADWDKMTGSVRSFIGTLQAA